ncbi:hypothetical protein [Polynucleobacter bastaniensis]|uniref:hypothetical protein n=1 Tax=Polynucleobacter bastaniensis TaxID=2081039 RepID=UPI001C0B0F1C|nr:hypothetical protein [Polynucleobacter bastaniensis]MBU3597397.1 hypothetical protein [Polynucleobacter bastaniensis]
MKKLISLEEMLVLTPYQFSNKFFVRQPKKFTPYNKGLKMPDSIRQKISLAQKGRNYTSFEARSRAQKGKPKSEALRLAVSKARKGKIGLLGDNGRARSVVCPEGIFSTIKEGAIAMDCDGGTFRNRIKRGVAGYSWAEVLT